MANFKFTISSLFKGEGIKQAQTALDGLEKSTKSAASNAPKLNVLDTITQLIKGDLTGATESVGKFGAELSKLGNNPYVLALVAVIVLCKKAIDMAKAAADKLANTLNEIKVERLQRETEKLKKSFDDWATATDKVKARHDSLVKTIGESNNLLDKNVISALELEKIEKMVAASTAEERAEIEKAYDARIRAKQAQTELEHIGVAMANNEGERADLARQNTEYAKRLAATQKQAAEAAKAEFRLRNEAAQLTAKQASEQERLTKLADAQKAKAAELTREAENLQKKIEANTAKAAELRDIAERILPVQKEAAETELKKVTATNELIKIKEAEAEAEKKLTEEKQKQENHLSKIKSLQEQIASTESELADIEENKKNKALRDGIAALKEQLATAQKIAGQGVNGNGGDDAWNSEDNLKKARKLLKKEERMNGLLGGKMNDRDSQWLADWKQNRNADRDQKKLAAEIAKKEKELKAAEEAKENARIQKVVDKLQDLRDDLALNLKAK